MFESIRRTADDAILSLIQQFQNDPNPNKVDLGVGVYRDASGITPILSAVKTAEQRLVDTQSTKSYIGSHGDPQFGELVLRLVLGVESEVLAAGRASATQTPGGCGALRLAMDLVARELQCKSVWMPEPTWPNHVAIAAAAGLKIQRYPYVGADNRFDFESMLAKLGTLPPESVVLFHACCHNPTGFDLSREQWRSTVEAVKQRKLLPIIDFAYQGFGDGLEEDAWCVRAFAERLDELIVTQSCSKNFGLYRERTGTFIVIARDAEKVQDVRSQMAGIARASYSNPPAHGAAVVTTILNSPDLTRRWNNELGQMLARIRHMREKFVGCMRQRGFGGRFGFVADQHGMFSCTGLDLVQVKRLREEFSIYMVGAGRANVAGLNDDNMGYVCDAIAQVVAHS